MNIHQPQTGFCRKGKLVEHSPFPKNVPGWNRWLENAIAALNTPADAPPLLRAFAKRELDEALIYFGSQ